MQLKQKYLCCRRSKIGQAEHTYSIPKNRNPTNSLLGGCDPYDLDCIQYICTCSKPLYRCVKVLRFWGTNHPTTILETLKSAFFRGYSAYIVHSQSKPSLGGNELPGRFFFSGTPSEMGVSVIPKNNT